MVGIFGGLVDIVIAIFLVLVFAEYAKIRVKAERAFKLIAGAAVLALLAAGSVLLAGVDTVGIGAGATILFSVIAWILLLIGAIVAVVELTKK